MTNKMIFPFPLLECLIYAAIFLSRFFTLHLEQKFLEKLELQVNVMNLELLLKQI